MIGIKFIKVQPTTYLLQYRGGKIVREGLGLSFFYYGVSSTMKALGSADAKILQALATTGMKPEQLIAFAFQELAGRADKIGQLNISPDLLRELLTPQPARK